MTNDQVAMTNAYPFGHWTLVLGHSFLTEFNNWQPARAEFVEPRPQPEWVGGIAGEEAFDHFAGLLRLAQFSEAPSKAAAGVVERAVGGMQRREAGGILRTTERLIAELKGVAEVAAGERNILLMLDGELAEQEVAFEQVAADLQQPAEFVDSDVVLAGGDHSAHLVEVVGAFAGTARMDQRPPCPAGGACDRDATGGRFGGAARGTFRHEEAWLVDRRHVAGGELAGAADMLSAVEVFADLVDFVGVEDEVVERE
jgi:hypothetical protein